ncbi:uncharacterized protein LOC107423877 [Ziziphus jujuba]|uniref:Uncharacterized protein LOC107423877 n=1 Tax=Ziziphus jujuba TaxID=326968 RepID=A0A6P3Z0M9_ZIZJJ|nr:uncharacterized protein LOC107423877 [Ziziphus jujuba]
MDHTSWNRVLMQFGGGSRSLLYTHTLQRDKDRDRVMDPNQSPASVSQEEFKLFHAIDRELYSLLVIKLWRDPAESMQIIALLMWLERTGFPNVIKKMISLPYILINELADEAVSCLNCINNNTTTTTHTDNIFINNTTTIDIPLIQCLMEKEVSLQFFHQNRLHANQEIKRILKEVCIRALKDIMQQSINERNKASTSQTQSPHMDNILSCVSANSFHQLHPSSLQVVQAASGFGRVGPVVGIGGGGGDHVVPAEERTMFVTFSKGYPVYEWEVREFFTRGYGDCIESLQMQEVQPNEQSLFARIVFHSASTIEMVLDGLSKAKFTINGKHVWVRKFVPKRPKTALISPTPPPPCCD